MRRSTLAALMVTVALAVSLPLNAQEKRTLTFVWHAGDRADLLLKLSQEYTRQTGVQIKAILPPLTHEYYQRIADEFARKGAAFDLCIFDSQSMSEFASQGHIVRLNDRLAGSQKVKAADFDPTALRMYAEYPDDSDNIYALPINQDCMGLVYRKDLLDDPKEKAAFKQKFGYELAVPETYDQLRDIAGFFTRPQDRLYGIALYGSADYDACTSAFNNIFWSFGADLWDPATGRAAGFINSPQAKRALEFYKGLFAFAPPGFQDAYVPEVNGAIEEGRVALGIQWYYYFREFAASAAGTTRQFAFAPLPGQKGTDGKIRRFVMVGGQGISINRYSPQQDEAWKFLEWLMSREQQWKWAEGGGKTGLAAILKDPKFLDAAPANRSFPVSMSMTKDYWHLPEYPQLLAVYQQRVHDAITGKLSPAAALDQCAAEHEKILTAARQQAAGKAATPLTVVARIKAKPGMEERVRQELAKLLAPTRVEKGCIHYDMHQSTTDPALFLFYENWESEDDLQRHLGSPHIAAWFKLSQELLAEPIQITRWRKVE
jgi:multiple sugar transport system substrate-binding protein